MKYSAFSLLLLLNPAACDNPFRTDTKKKYRPKSKGGKKGQPQCDQDAFLVARYGYQLCPNELDAKFERIDGSRIQSYGLPHFNKPTYSAPVSDVFDTIGLVALTFDQAISVCVTKCENDSGCDAVSVRERPANRYPSGKLSYRCEMVNTDLGPGSYVQAVPQDYIDNAQCTAQTSVFKKIGAAIVPSFEEVQCNITPSNEAMNAGIACTLGAITDPAICGALLTDDWNKYFAPGVLCVAQNGGAEAVNACFTCVAGQPPYSYPSICPVDAADTSTILRNQCADECLADKCETPLLSTQLCQLGAPLMHTDGQNRAGEITGPDFVCPPVS